VAVAATTPAAHDPAAWTYASGLASALEGRLLTQRATQELLDARDLDDLVTRVRQSLLFADLAEGTAALDLAETMEAAYAAGIRTIRDACPAPAVAELFLLPIEWQAYRVYLREQALGGQPVDTPGSAVPREAWERCWATPDVEPRWARFAAAALNVREKMPREKHDERLVDEISEVYQARDITHAATRLGNPQILAWVTTWLELRLALALLRCARNDWGHIRYVDALDDFGVGQQEILALVTPDRGDWRTPFAHLGLPTILSVPDDHRDPAPTVARLIDDRVTDLVRDARGIPFGPEPVFAFLWALRVEAVNLKQIVAGVAAGLPGDAIAQEMRAPYV